jgi:hypothetical protein
VNRFRRAVGAFFRGVIIAAITTFALVVAIVGVGALARAVWALLTFGPAFTPGGAVVFLAIVVLLARLTRGGKKVRS